MPTDTLILNQLDYGKAQLDTGQMSVEDYLDYVAFTIYPRMAEVPMGRCPVCGFNHPKDAVMLNTSPLPRS